MRALAQPTPISYHRPWHDRVRPLIAELDLEPIFALMPAHTYQPDFLSPPPSGPHPELDAELAIVAAMPLDTVAAEIERCLRDQHSPPRLGREALATLRDPQRARDLLVELLRRAWSALLAPWWEQVRGVMDADVAVRARQLADEGVAAVLDDLHPGIALRHGQLQLAVGADEQLGLVDHGLVLMPSVFAWPHVGLCFGAPWSVAISYPARGIARIWEPTSVGTAELSRLMGATRARLLAAAVEPASTSSLATRCALPLSTVSEHLTVLRATGLVKTVRIGRSLVHEVTPLGLALVGGSHTPVGASNAT